MSTLTTEQVLPTRQRSKERADMLAGVITTALEGGVGYWSQASVYKWWDPNLDGGSAEHREGEPNAYAVLHETQGAERECEVCGGTGEVKDESGSHSESDDMQECEACYGTGGAPLLVTVEMVAEAMSKIVDGDVNLAPDYIGRIAIAKARPDEADLDAGDCDAIVQVAVFGEVIYG
jgi:hypothetical protein